MEHTPLPYVFKRITKGFAIDAKTGKYDSPVSFVYAPFEHEKDKEFDSTIAECKANAEFIVRACNSHYELLNLAKAYSAFAYGGKDPEINKAIAKAEAV